MRMRKSRSDSQHLRIPKCTPVDLHPVCTLDTNFYDTLFPLLVPHHVTCQCPLHRSPSGQNSSKESGVQLLGSFGYQSQETVPRCLRLVKPR